MESIIKINDEHYVIVDDSEIKEGDFVLALDTNVVFQADTGEIKKPIKQFKELYKKITHSTQPEVLGTGWMQSVLPLLLSEVEEAIYGYSVEKMAEEYAKTVDDLDIPYQNGLFYGYLEGFKAHQELVKDKVFTVEDIIYIIDNISQNWYKCYSELDKKEHLNKIINVLSSKTEWDIEFIDGKIKLL